MNPRPDLLLTTAAIIYFIVALPLLFAPQELCAYAGTAASPAVVSLLQLLGSALFGFAMLDWLSRFTSIGGIYGRPLVVANFAHAACAALLLGHLTVRGGWSTPLFAALIPYSLLAIGFGAKLLGRSPSKQTAP